jgi:DNA-binding NtrC family response regulator
MESTKNIVVVDDEPSFRNILSSILQNEGYSVETASDGDEVIPLVGKKKIDLMLLDIQMKRVGGFEVLEYVKKNKPEIKVIMLTGFSELANAVKSKSMGAEAFISKPYDLIDLLDTIKSVLASA